MFKIVQFLIYYKINKNTKFGFMKFYLIIY